MPRGTGFPARGFGMGRALRARLNASRYDRRSAARGAAGPPGRSAVRPPSSALRSPPFPPVKAFRVFRGPSSALRVFRNGSLDPAPVRDGSSPASSGSALLCDKTPTPFFAPSALFRGHPSALHFLRSLLSNPCPPVKIPPCVPCAAQRDTPRPAIRRRPDMGWKAHATWHGLSSPWVWGRPGAPRAAQRVTLRPPLRRPPSVLLRQTSSVPRRVPELCGAGLNHVHQRRQLRAGGPARSRHLPPAASLQNSNRKSRSRARLLATTADMYSKMSAEAPRRSTGSAGWRSVSTRASGGSKNARAGGSDPVPAAVRANGRGKTA